MTEEKLHWVISAKGSLFPFFDEKTVVYRDGYRVLNPSEAPREWKASTRVSPSFRLAQPILLFPFRVETAYYLMSQEVHACGLIFDDEPVKNPWPFGPVWINLSDGKHSWGAHMTKASYMAKGYRGVMGHLIQDGCKFSSSCRENKYPTVQGIILKKGWLPYLRELLDCALVQNEPWHNGTGVHC